MLSQLGTQMFPLKDRATGPSFHTIMSEQDSLRNLFRSVLSWFAREYLGTVVARKSELA